MQKTPLLAALTLIIACSAAIAQPQLTWLTPPPGGAGTHISDVSADGLHVVGWATTADGIRAFGRTHFQGVVLLGAMPGGSDSFATGVDATGTVIVGWGITPSGSRAFRWNDNGGIVPLALPDGDTWSKATAVSPNGQWIVGQSGTTSRRYATLWTNGTAVHLAEPAEAAASSATAVSDSGTVVGHADMHNGSTQPLLWEGGVVTTLGLRAGETHALVTAVTVGGVPFGGSLNETAADAALSWSDPLNPSALTMPVPTDTALVYDVNADGSVYVGRTASNALTAFVTGGVVGNRVLVTYLIQTGASFSGLLHEATGVSAAGTVVVGNGFYADFPQGWILRLPGAPALCPADFGVEGGFAGQDGQLNNNDFIAFISFFFLGDMRADIGAQGGLAGSDGALDNNDFIVFITHFFGGCP